MKKGLSIAGIVLIVLILFAVVIGNVIISNNNYMNKMEVSITKLSNNIDIENQQLIDIQMELKKMVQEYTNYEHKSNELVVTNLDPSFVVNMYPELKSSSMYNKLNRQYLTCMRNIKDMKEKYNIQVEKYNSELVTFKGRLLFMNRSLIEYEK